MFSRTKRDRVAGPGYVADDAVSSAGGRVTSNDPVVHLEPADRPRQVPALMSPAPSAPGQDGDGPSDPAASRWWGIRRGDRGLGRGFLLLTIVIACAAVGAAVWALLVRQPTRRSVADQFSGPSHSLEGSHPTTAPPGVRWTESVGSFIARDGAAFASGGAARSIATVDVGSKLHSLRVDLLSTRAGSGILFRYLDPQNYWSLVAAPGYGTWNIYKTLQGRSEFMANTGLSFTAASTSLEVDLSDQLIQVVINRTQQQVIFDSALSTATRVGLLASTGDVAMTQWRHFVATGS